jgi:type III restriction enzyme
MGRGADRKDSLVVEVDAENPDKDIDALDIALPRLTRRYQREYHDLSTLDPAAFYNVPLPLKPFAAEETREIVFKTMLDDEAHHTVELGAGAPVDYRSVIAFFARQLLKELRLVGGYDLLYPRVRDFMRDHLFEGSPVDLEDPVVLRNLAEPAAGKLLFDNFFRAINSLTVRDAGSVGIDGYIRLRDMRPFRTGNRAYLAPKRSLFNRIVGEPHSGGLEMTFATFLDDAEDVAAFAKNYLALGFKIDYVKANGELSNYIPDFIVRTTDGTVWIVETKGRAELELPKKIRRLAQWCADAAESEGGDSATYRFIYVDQEGFGRHRPHDFAALVASFTEYQA